MEDTSHRVRIEFEDGETAALMVRPGEAVYAAAKRAGVTLASDCRQGQCKTCQCEARQGTLVYPADVHTTLSDDDLAAGKVLPCVGTVKGDTLLYAPYKRHGLLAPKTKSVQLEAIEPLSQSVMRLRCKLGPATRMEFLPGQYMQIKVPGTEQLRSYSMSTAPTDRPRMEFLVRLLDDGLMSNFLRTADAGGKIELTGPFGTFYLRENAGPIIMIAGGTGLAPILSMLTALAQRTVGQQIILCFGAASGLDVFLVDDLVALKDRLPGLDLRIAVERADAGWQGLKGNAVDLIGEADAAVATSPDAAAYLCGPPGMIEAARRRLLALGMKAQHVYAEEFLPSGR